MNIETIREGDAPVYKVDLDEATDESPSYTVVESIANLTDRGPNDLEPLWGSVDPEALDSFVAHAIESSTPYQLAFQYEGYAVEVVDDGWLRLIPKKEPLRSASA